MKHPRVIRTAITFASFAAALAGCRPITSHDSIYGNAATETDPATRAPYLGLEGPARADSPIQLPEPSGTPMVVAPAPTQTYQSVDLGSAKRTLRAWIDGVEPGESVGSRTLRLTAPVSRLPRVKFELAPSLGQFRGAMVQVYRVANDQADKDSGVRFQEDGEYTLLVPGKEIDLGQSAPTLARRIADGTPLRVFELAADTEYEIQFLISGSKASAVMGVRVRTAKPPAATQPATSRPDGDSLPKLPPGVEIPR